MKGRRNTKLVYVISILITLAVGGISALVNAGQMTNTGITQPALTPPAWIFPIVWTVLFTLMGISAASVYLSDCPGKSDALFIYTVQLTVNFLWTVFYFSFQALSLAFFWLIFLILLILLMIVRFERCSTGSGKLQIPYFIWCLFAAYLNFAAWMLN